MPRLTVQQRYDKTISLEAGLADAVNLAEPRMRFWVLQKHIRFQVLNAIVQGRQNMDLKRYILQLHHEGEQLSQRDITANIKSMVDGMGDDELRRLLAEVFEEVWQMLKEMEITDFRSELCSTLRINGLIDEKAKRVFFERATEDRKGDYIFERLRSFDHKTIEEFIRLFRLPVRNAKQKFKGKSVNKKMSQARTERNIEMWSDPVMRAHICARDRVAWSSRKIAARYEDQE